MEEMNEQEEQQILAALGEEDTESPSEVEEEAVVDESQEEVVPDEEEVKVPLKAVQEERRKRQELERKLEEIQKGIEGLKAEKAPAPPKDIYEAYDRDAQGVTSQLNAQIQKLVNEDPYGNAANIEQLRDLKDELRRREVNSLKNTLNQQTKASEAITFAKANIPDLESIVPALQEFAVNELDYTPEELFAKVDINRGVEGAKELVRIYKMYQRLHAKPQAKETRPRPTAVENPGRGVTKSEPDLSALLKEAQATGNWEKYFDARGLL